MKTVKYFAWFMAILNLLAILFMLLNDITPVFTSIAFLTSLATAIFYTWLDIRNT
jgi:hypothetical protein